MEEIISQDVVPTRKIVLFTLLYFLLLILLIAATVLFDIKLYSGDGLLRFPTRWLVLLWGLYYVVPFAVAGMFGFRIRPFWRNVLILVISIFAIHFLYSAAVSVPRFLYVQAWQKDIQQGKAGTLTINSFGHTFIDANNDGLTDNIVLKGAIDASSLTNGDYLIIGNLSQNGRVVPGGGIGTYNFSLIDSHNGYSFAFEIDPADVKNFIQSGNFDVNLVLKKHIRPDAYGKSLLFLCRWAAFFCPTSKEGYDPIIYADIIPIQEITRVDTFSLSQTALQRDQVTFIRFVNDVARDTNGNGIVDELVVQMEFDSIYEGPLYVSAQINGSPNFFSQTTYIKKGVTIVEFVIKDNELRKLGFDGPYQLNNFYVLNNDPYCPGGACVMKHTPAFTVYLQDYLTKPYRLEQFE